MCVDKARCLHIQCTPSALAADGRSARSCGEPRRPRRAATTRFEVTTILCGRLSRSFGLLARVLRCPFVYLKHHKLRP